MNQYLEEMFINPEMTFENFVVGHSNQRAYEASLAVARNPGKGLNPLFIYSTVGCGATHLAQAILNHVLKEGIINRDHMCWITAEDFFTGLAHSIQNEKLPCFRTHFDNLNMLLIDNVQCMSRIKRMQVELGRMLDTLYDNMKQIVITCNRHPRELNDTEQLLRSRFEWGWIVETGTPELQTKLTILEHLAQKEGVELPDDVALYLAGDSAISVRELEGRFFQVWANSCLLNLPISLDLAKKIL